MAVRIPGINIDEYYQQLGPIEPLIRDDRVTEIMVNGSDHVYVEMGGKVVLTNIKFTDEDQLPCECRHPAPGLERPAAHG